ncbi:MAG TPA: hypothetical protein VK849_15005, partial [Longimicrobiales bacterium]|nr:hypothetical protein [Longimicrobiales bacterium]
MKRIAGLAVLSLAIAVTGCAREEASPASVARDSAGIEILESLRPAWGSEARWRIGPEPLLRIGVSEGDPTREFSGVTGALRMRDGTVVVADAGSQEVRFFGEGGRFLTAVGRRGAGPGEFTGLSGLGRGPDHDIWAWDFSLRRVTWLDATGRILRTVSLAPEPPVLSPVGALPDGSFVLKQLWGAQRVAEATRTGLRRDPVAYVRFDSTGALVDTLGLFPGREVFLTEEDGRGVMSTPPFGRNSVAAVWRGAVLVGAQTIFELEARTADGVLRRILRIPTRDVELRPEEALAFLEERIADALPRERPGVRRTFEAIPLPATRPAHGAILVDAAANLWVSEWEPNIRAPARWTVLAPDGRWLGDL